MFSRRVLVFLLYQVALLVLEFVSETSQATRYAVLKEVNPWYRRTMYKMVTPSGLPSTCSPAFQKVHVNHTMCLWDHPEVTKTGVSAADRKLILDLHNKYRTMTQFPAANMVKLYWDDDLAEVAAKWAKQCYLGHDAHRELPGHGKSTGQNCAAGYLKWHDAVSHWFNEQKLYRYGFEPDSYLGRGNWVKIGHFTMLANWQASRIGCGYAACPFNPKRFYVCNYEGGQKQSEVKFPYKVGKRCSDCPNNCDGGLCDCKGIFCKNFGKLDVGKCTCKCMKLFKGDECEIPNCPPTDPFYCGEGNYFPPSACIKYGNVPGMCPYMCGICSGGKTTTTTTAAPTEAMIIDEKEATTTTTSTTTTTTTTTTRAPTTTPKPGFVCDYNGPKPSASECKGFGDSGDDMVLCKSKGGVIGCRECQTYYNIKRDICPVMCGYCPAPCSGKKCFNEGVLNKETCVCECKIPFEGDRCDKAKCGDPDRTPCERFNSTYCGLYYNTNYTCPVLCGFC